MDQETSFFNSQEIEFGNPNISTKNGLLDIPSFEIEKSQRIIYGTQGGDDQKSESLGNQRKSSTGGSHNFSKIKKNNVTLEKLKLKGLINVGNTCYINSVLQCLLSIPAIQICFGSFCKDFYKDSPFSSKYNSHQNISLSYEFCNFIQEYNSLPKFFFFFFSFYFLLIHSFSSEF